MSNDFLLSDHFLLSELTKSDTALRKGIDNTPDEVAVENLICLCNEILEPVRVHYGIPFIPHALASFALFGIDRYFLNYY